MVACTLSLKNKPTQKRPIQTHKKGERKQSKKRQGGRNYGFYRAKHPE